MFPKHKGPYGIAGGYEKHRALKSVRCAQMTGETEIQRAFFFMDVRIPVANVVGKSE